MSAPGAQPAPQQATITEGPPVRLVIGLIITVVAIRVKREDLAGVNPMAAPTDALRRGDYRRAIDGEPETARFSIRVT